MKIFNGTAHNIHIVRGATFNQQLPTYTLGNGKVTRVITSSDMLNAKITTTNTGNIDDIPQFQKRTEGYSPLLEGYDVYIVSLLYVQAYTGKDKEKLFTVADPVMSNDGKTFIGCRGLTKAF